MNPRRSLAAVAAASALALVAGCGTAAIGGRNDSSAPPKTELVHSTRALGNAKKLTTTISLDTTSAEVLRIASLGGPSSLTASQAQAIAGAHVSIEMVAAKGKTVGQDGLTPGTSALELTAGTGSATYLTVRSVGGSVYAQVDLKDFLALIGEAKEYAVLQAKAASLPAFAKDFVAGKWVSISLVTIKAIEAFAKSADHGKLPADTKVGLLDGKLLTAILGALTVTRPSIGTTDHLVITTNLRRLADAVLPVFATLIPEVRALPKGLLGQIPQTPIGMNAYVTHGALSKLTFDPGQFSKKHPFSLPIVASFSRSGSPISTPTGATPITLVDLLGLLHGSSQGSGASYPDYLPSPSVPTPIASTGL